jgi:hypothetical protein
MNDVSAMMARRATEAETRLILRDFDPGSARKIFGSRPLWDEPSENPDRGRVSE